MADNLLLAVHSVVNSVTVESRREGSTPRLLFTPLTKSKERLHSFGKQHVQQ